MRGKFHWLMKNNDDKFPHVYTTNFVNPYKLIPNQVVMNFDKNKHKYMLKM